MCYRMMTLNQDESDVQDTIHIAGKLRCRLLNESKKLVIGNKTASIKHLKELVKNVHKSVHGLNNTDVTPVDKQNFKSFDKMVDERVILALSNSVNGSHLFLPTIFDSQTVEKAFRQLRSMGTVDYTRINFTLYDLLHMIGRIEVQNDIAYFKLSEGNVSFPLSHKRSKKTQFYELPSDIEIDSTLQEAKQAALQDAQMFGMESPDDLDTGHQFHSNVFSREDGEEDDEIIDHSIEVVEEHGDIGERLDSNSPFTNVIDENGHSRVIRKSTKKVSKDRLRRVQVSKRRRNDE